MNKAEEEFKESFEKVKGRIKERPEEAVIWVSSQIVHHCVAAVVVLAIKNVVPISSRKEKFQVYVAARMMSGIVADTAADRFATKATKVAAFCRPILNKIRGIEIVTEEKDLDTEKEESTESLVEDEPTQ